MSEMYPNCKKGPSPVCKWCDNDSKCGELIAADLKAGKEVPI